jgi:RNA polymerase sigma-70 factor (family 1)
MSDYRTLNDIQLTDLLRSDDHAAFAEIYKRYWEKLFVVANNRLGNDLEAEEVVQDVFYSIWKRRETLQIEYTLATYLSVAVKYQVINRQSALYRRSAHEVELNASVEEQVADTTQLWFAEKELKQQLAKAVNNLPEKCRIVFLKSREEGKTNAVIAEELEISEKTVEAHITRAIHHLKESLQVSLPFLLFLLKK